MNEAKVIPQSFKTIVENLPNGVNLCDLEGTILNTNPSMLAIMQADHASQLVGRRLKEFLLPHCLPLYEGCLLEALTGDAKLMELEALSLAGEPLCLESHLLPLRDGEDQVTHFLSLIYDRTQGKKNAALAWQRQAQLEHASRLSLLGELTSGLAHEINQPLAAIINYVKGCERRLQRDECSMDEILAALDQVCQQAERASGIVKQVRQFAKKGSSSESKPVDLHQVLRESLSLLEVDRAMFKVEVIRSLASDLPLVLGDRLQLEQVMINLLRNGMEAISAVGGGCLHVSTQAVEGGLQVEVCDVGKGLPEVDEERLFEAFFSTKKEGMGMGLSISRSLVERHGGRLWAENRAEGGARFVFFLPEADVG